MIGGVGICGLPFCCSTFLDEFDGISINMAKNQFLALNIQKLSGACGKLICCLKYENDQYSDIRRGLPKIGLRIQYDNATFKITSINILTHQVRLENSDTIRMVPLDEVMELVRKQTA
jgi:cell fate regulator YaaT (PSP1 superfamily)